MSWVQFPVANFYFLGKRWDFCRKLHHSCDKIAMQSTNDRSWPPASDQRRRGVDNLRNSHSFAVWKVHQHPELIFSLSHTPQRRRLLYESLYVILHFQWQQSLTLYLLAGFRGAKIKWFVAWSAFRCVFRNRSFVFHAKENRKQNFSLQYVFGRHYQKQEERIAGDGRRRKNCKSISMRITSQIHFVKVFLKKTFPSATQSKNQ